MNWFTFDGRMNRLTYFLQILLTTCVSVVLGFLIGMAMGFAGMSDAGISLVSGLYGVIVMVYCFSLAVRRLHDLDKSGWWVLLALLPFVNFILGLLLLFVRGTNGPNRFGPDPLAPMSAPPAQ